MSFAVCIIRECLSQAHLRSEEGARLIVTVEFFYQKGKNEEVGGQEVVFIPTRGVVKLQSSSCKHPKKKYELQSLIFLPMTCLQRLAGSFRCATKLHFRICYLKGVDSCND